MRFKMTSKNPFRNFVRNLRRITISELEDKEKDEFYRQLYDEMKNDLKESVQKKGIRNPLSVRENDKGYVVEVGNQRLQALKELGIQKVPCVINTKNKKDLEEIPSTKELEKYFKDGFDPFKDLGHIQPSNYKEWDGELVYGR